MSMIQYEIPTIPGEYILITSLLISIYIAYQSRMNGLENWRDREQFMREKLVERVHISKTIKVETSTVEVHEKTGLRYRFSKFFTGKMQGHTYIVLSYLHQEKDSDFWESDGAQEFLDSFDFKVEHLSTVTYTDPSYSKFKIGSTEAKDVQEFGAKFVKADEFIAQSKATN